jgi:flagellar protein FlaG|tara:strand:- start:385 stop:774 length:390 start_codon:yes stop_codon:yes gene_type:complete
MGIEALSASPQIVPQMVDKKVRSSQPVADVNATPVVKPKPVPEPPKVNINREPIISSKELEAKISELNEAMVSRNQDVVFSTDAATGKDVVRVSNKSTGELIRQMPSAEALKAMQNIDQMMGLIFNQKT